MIGRAHHAAVLLCLPDNVTLEIDPATEGKFADNGAGIPADGCDDLCDTTIKCPSAATAVAMPNTATDTDLVVATNDTTRSIPAGSHAAAERGASIRCGDVVWQVQGTDGWKSYTPGETATLETTYQLHRTAQHAASTTAVPDEPLVLQGGQYSVDFVLMEQTNTATFMPRMVRRHDTMATPPHTRSGVGHVIPPD